MCLVKLYIISVLSIYSDKQANRCGIFEKKKLYLKPRAISIFSFGEKVKLNDKNNMYNKGRILLGTFLTLTYLFLNFSSSQKKSRSQESMEEIHN